MRMKIEFQLECRVRHDDKTNLFVSSCPSLGLFSQGRTEHEAREAIEDGLGMYLRACLKRGILEEVLQRCGFEPTNNVPPSVQPVRDGHGDDFVSVAPDVSREHTWDVDVPLYLLPPPGGARSREKAPCPS